MVSMATENNSQEESFAALFEESLKHEDVKEGDIVKGRVIHVGKDHVVVDIGYKSEGTIPLYEFTQATGRSASKKATRSTSSSRAARTKTGSAFSPRRRRTASRSGTKSPALASATS